MPVPRKLFPINFRCQVQKTEDELSGITSTILATLRECTRSRDLQAGKEAHSLAASHNILSDVYVSNNLISMYGKCGSMAEAKKVFDSMNSRTVVSWNCYIQGYVDNGENEQGLDIFSKMQDKATPDARTYVAVLTACANLAAQSSNEKGTSKWLELGKRIHSQAAKSQTCNTILENTLINMYGKCGCLVLARSVFDHMLQRTVVSWNALLQGYVENGENELALELFHAMQGCLPNDRTFVAAITACASLGARRDESLNKWLSKGRDLHSRASSSGFCNMLVATSLLDMYAKCKSMRDARGAFDRMRHKDVVTWTCLIQGYVDNGESQLALELFHEMEARGGCKPDARTYLAALTACSSLAASKSSSSQTCFERGKAIYSKAVQFRGNIFLENALVNLYTKCGRTDQAREIFNKMARRDSLTWRCMVQGYVDWGESEKALELVTGLDIGFESGTLIAALTVCGNLMATEIGRGFHAEVLRGGYEEELAVSACAVELYGKCGEMEVSELVFNSLGVKDVWTWNGLLCGYSQRGDARRVFGVYREMRELDVLPNSVTFTHLLSVCGHVGLTSKGRECFESMQREFKIEADIVHYTCMVDLVARANKVEEAQEIIKGMPFEPNAVTWTALLSACRKWKNVSAGRSAFESLVKLSETDTAAYALMANLYTDL